jgi:hypothetical protein
MLDEGEGRCRRSSSRLRPSPSSAAAARRDSGNPRSDLLRLRLRSPHLSPALGPGSSRPAAHMLPSLLPPSVPSIRAKGWWLVAGANARRCHSSRITLNLALPRTNGMLPTSLPVPGAADVFTGPRCSRRNRKGRRHLQRCPGQGFLPLVTARLTAVTAPTAGVR